MRARRTAALSASAALLVTLVACGADETADDTGAATTETEASDGGADTTSAETHAQEEGSSAQPELESAGPDEEQSADDGTEETSDAEEPGGDDAQWISPGSSDQGDGPGAGGPLLAVDVRSGIHDYYDRVVIDLQGENGDGDVAPGWYAEYTGEPVEDGSGFPIEIDGNAFLQVSATGFRYPEADEEFVHGITRVDGTGVTEVYVGAPFEGQILVYLGVDSARPYRVFTLTDPLRLVIDIEIAG